MKARNALKLLFLAVAALTVTGIVTAPAPAHAEEIEWYNGTPSKTTKRTTGTLYPLPVYIEDAATLTTLTCTTGSNLALSTTSETVFSANTSRKSVIITNNDTSIAIKVCRKTEASTAGCPRVPAGQSWVDEPRDGYLYLGAITAYSESGTPAISTEECQGFGGFGALLLALLLSRRRAASAVGGVS